MLVIDADTILYASAAQQQKNRCNAKHTSSGREKLFDSKTEFNDWIKANPKWKKEDFECEVVSEVVGEPRFAFQSINQKVDKIVEAAGCKNYMLIIEGEGNFRKDFEAKYTDYKGQRTDKPILFEECREFFLRKFQGRAVQAVGIETDDMCNQYAWRSYLESDEGENKAKADIVLAYCDKDLAANSRGHLINYMKLENGIFWNDGFTQEYNFAIQLLKGDSADNILGLENLSDKVKKEFGIRSRGLGDATAIKLLDGCTTIDELKARVAYCYKHSVEDDWEGKMSENGFFLYLLRNQEDKWSLDTYLKGVNLDD